MVTEEVSINTRLLNVAHLKSAGQFSIDLCIKIVLSNVVKSKPYEYNLLATRDLLEKISLTLIHSSCECSLEFSVL